MFLTIKANVDEIEIDSDDVFDQIAVEDLIDQAVGFYGADEVIGAMKKAGVKADFKDKLMYGRLTDKEMVLIGIILDTLRETK